MPRNTRALGAALAAGIALFLTACGTSSDSVEPLANQSTATATATPSPTPTEIPCFVGTWRFKSASWLAYRDWWNASEDVTTEASDELDDLVIDADGTYWEELAAEFTALGSPGRKLLVVGKQEGRYTFTAATITFLPSRDTVQMQSFESGRPLMSGEYTSEAIPATYTCKNDELRLNRDGGRWVTYFRRV